MIKFSLAIFLLASPIAFADCPGQKIASTASPAALTKILSFDGCANEGGNCSASVPCCGTASCVRGRCQEVPEQLAKVWLPKK